MVSRCNHWLTRTWPAYGRLNSGVHQTRGIPLLRVHLPLIRGGILMAALVVFVDCMKELPATLILRPFNFDTLATYVYQFASDELFGSVRWLP